jgi:bla regulator protein BlaR1
MINWLLFQSFVASAILISLMAGKYHALRFIGAKGYYFLWTLVPFSILMGLVPSIQPSNYSMAYYLVPLKEATHEIGSSFSELSDGIIALWSLGAIFFLCRLIIAHRRHLNFLDLKPINQEDQNFSEVLRQLKPCRNISLKISVNTTGPFIGGLLNPYIVLPKYFTKCFSPEQQRLVIKHELNHLRRGDLIWNLLAQIFVVLFWFNPLNFVAYRCFRQSQELACDQSILENSEKSTRIAYGKAMLLCPQQESMMPLIHLTYGAKPTMQERIEQLKKHRPQPLWRWLTAAGLMFTLVMSVNLVSAKGTNKALLREESPIIRIEPVYPLEAIDKGIEGSVILSFDIQKNGAASNVNIISAEPKRIFDQSAKDAVKQWKYKPHDAKRSGLLVQLDYAMDTAPANKEIVGNDTDHERIAVTRH